MRAAPGERACSFNSRDAHFPKSIGGLPTLQTTQTPAGIDKLCNSGNAQFYFLPGFLPSTMKRASLASASLLDLTSFFSPCKKPLDFARRQMYLWTGKKKGKGREPRKWKRKKLYFSQNFLCGKGQEPLTLNIYVLLAPIPWAMVWVLQRERVCVVIRTDKNSALGFYCYMPILRRPRQGYHEFQTSMGYIENLRSDWNLISK